MRHYNIGVHLPKLGPEDPDADFVNTDPSDPINQTAWNISYDTLTPHPSCQRLHDHEELMFEGEFGEEDPTEELWEEVYGPRDPDELDPDDDFHQDVPADPFDFTPQRTQTNDADAELNDQINDLLEIFGVPIDDNRPLVSLSDDPDENNGSTAAGRPLSPSMGGPSNWPLSGQAEQQVKRIMALENRGRRKTPSTRPIDPPSPDDAKPRGGGGGGLPPSPVGPDVMTPMDDDWLPDSTWKKAKPHFAWIPELYENQKHLPSERGMGPRPSDPIAPDYEKHPSGGGGMPINPNDVRVAGTPSAFVPSQAKRLIPNGRRMEIVRSRHPIFPHKN